MKTGMLSLEFIDSKDTNLSCWYPGTRQEAKDTSINKILFKDKEKKIELFHCKGGPAVE